MKQLILIAAFLVAAATKMIAQELVPIEIKKMEKSSVVANGNHEFAMVAHEDLEVNLKFFLKEEDKVKVMVTDSNENVVLNKEYKKQGNNKVDFEMEKEEKYSIKLSGEKPSNLVVYVDEN